MKTFFISIFLYFSLLSCLAPSKKNNVSQNFSINGHDFFIRDIGYENIPLNNLEGINHIQFHKYKVDSLDPFLYETRNGVEFSSSSIELYYYALVDTTNYYSVLYFSFNEANEQCYDLVNYSKNYEIIDFYRGISCFGGDGEYFYETIGEFVNDSIIKQKDSEGIYKNDLNGSSLSTKEYKSQKDKIIKIDKKGNIKEIELPR